MQDDRRLHARQRLSCEPSGPRDRAIVRLSSAALCKAGAASSHARWVTYAISPALRVEHLAIRDSSAVPASVPNSNQEYILSLHSRRNISEACLLMIDAAQARRHLGSERSHRRGMSSHQPSVNHTSLHDIECRDLLIGILLHVKSGAGLGLVQAGIKPAFRTIWEMYQVG